MTVRYGTHSPIDQRPHDARTITVYRDSPLWGRHARWFQLPLGDLEALFVAQYIVEGPWVDDVDMARQAAKLRTDYPDCVLVY